jgi:hypothetical protein
MQVSTLLYEKTPAQAYALSGSFVLLVLQRVKNKPTKV